MTDLPKLRRKTSPQRSSSSKELILFAAILGVAVIGNQMMPGQRARRAHDAVVREQHQQSDANSAIADRRYSEACTMPVSETPIKGYYVQAIALSVDGPIPLNPTTGQPLEGHVVCDDRGMTAEVENGRLVNIARSGDQALINQRFADALGWHEDARRSLH